MPHGNTGCPPRTQPRTRRVVFIAAPGTEILDLVGPLQVFARAAEMFTRQNPGSPPIYSVEVITTSPRTSVATNCGLRITAHNTFRRGRGENHTPPAACGGGGRHDRKKKDCVTRAVKRSRL